jgi:hypothetical protein
MFIADTDTVSNIQNSTIKAGIITSQNPRPNSNRTGNVTTILLRALGCGDIAAHCTPESSGVTVGSVHVTPMRGLLWTCVLTTGAALLLSLLSFREIEYGVQYAYVPGPDKAANAGVRRGTNPSPPARPPWPRGWSRSR